MNNQDYLKEDYDEALREHYCLVECASRISEKLQANDLTEIHLLISDMKKSATTIQTLQVKKKEYEKLVTLIVHMKGLGVNIEMIQRRIGGLYE